jgi:hypothetical protein
LISIYKNQTKSNKQKVTEKKEKNRIWETKFSNVLIFLFEVKQ